MHEDNETMTGEEAAALRVMVRAHRESPTEPIFTEADVGRLAAQALRDLQGDQADANEKEWQRKLAPALSSLCQQGYLTQGYRLTPKGLAFWAPETWEPPSPSRRLLAWLRRTLGRTRS